MTTQNRLQLTLSELMDCLDEKKTSQDILPKQLLQQSVERVLSRYFEEISEAPIENLHQIIVKEVEPPLIQAVLRYTRFNRRQAAQYLGISRATLHKKIKIYELDLWLEKEKRLPLPSTFLFKSGNRGAGSVTPSGDAAGRKDAD